MTRQEVYSIIDSERDYQDERWGGRSHDGNHSVGDFIVYMEYYLNKAKQEYTTAYHTDKTALEQLRKVTALGVVVGEVFGFPERN